MSPTDEQVRAFIELVTYKPGWAFDIRRSDSPLGDGWTLMARTRVEDADSPGNETKLTQIRQVPDYVFDYDNWKSVLAYQVERLIRDLEGHERLEWLKLDGQWFWHPHPNGESASEPYGEAFKASEAAHV